MNTLKKNLLAALLLCQILTVSAADTIVKGFVKDTNGNPVSGVPVSDGRNVTVTDSNGCYSLTTDPERNPLVYISTPAAYHLPQTEGIANGFYQPLKTETTENICNFTLQKRNQPCDNFIFIPISDPQVINDQQFDRFRSETVPDLKQTVDSLKAYEIVGMGLGDMVWDRMDYMQPYINAVKNWGLTMFQVPGNHDLNKKYADLGRTQNTADGYAEQDYLASFGPTNYSFNIGKVHIIGMKSTDYKGGKKYVEYLTDEQLEWLKNDLSYVPKGTTVFLNLHAPVANTTVFAGGNVRNANALFNILRPYEVHIFSGHTHYYENTRPHPTIYEHNIGAACGAWWAGDVNRCGAPNGYLIVTIKGNDIKWRYKATKQGPDYQFRLYKPGKFETQKQYVVANIWDWDNAYLVNWYEDGVMKGAMQQFEDEDQAYIQQNKGKRSGYKTRHLFRAKPSPNAKTVTVEVTNRFGETFTQTIKL